MISVIGDVRGMVSVQAIEFVVDPVTKQPPTALTAPLHDQAKRKGPPGRQGAGLYGNVFRISPPLIISKSDVDEVHQDPRRVTRRRRLMTPQPCATPYRSLVFAAETSRCVECADLGPVWTARHPTPSAAPSPRKSGCSPATLAGTLKKTIFVSTGPKTGLQPVPAQSPPRAASRSRDPSA